ncbi:hypothetical protein EYF80_010347 [Liparis tanakae]|uniref:Uncharacterized protein n=1 Tax=Liparis tanakae TaxID=230148 RepID=A0A4Z2IPE7_9TELE|nr:hypothetical protein EYF80_010347 [Liparis tanakae]
MFSALQHIRPLIRGKYVMVNWITVASIRRQGGVLSAAPLKTVVSATGPTRRFDSGAGREQDRSLTCPEGLEKWSTGTDLVPSMTEIDGVYLVSYPCEPLYQIRDCLYWNYVSAYIP